MAGIYAASVALAPTIGLGRAAGYGFDLISREVDQAKSAEMFGRLREAARGKGNFGVGQGTRDEADELGKAWVGPGYRTSSNGKTLISADGLRQYRPPSLKRSGIVQANFESRPVPSGKWQSNAHLDIK